MSLLQKDSAHDAGDIAGIIPDTNDPTAGQVAISRELASEQVRMIADPAPLGLCAFALTTFLLSLVNAGVVDKATEPVVLGVALAYGEGKPASQGNRRTYEILTHSHAPIRS
jgi:uncharacterized protein